MTDRPSSSPASLSINPIDDMLGMTHAASSLSCVRAAAPWGIAFASKEQSRLVVITHGSCILVSDAVEVPLRLAAGDAFIVQADVAFTLQDRIGREIVDCVWVFDRAEGHTAEYGGDGPVTEVVSGRFTFENQPRHRCWPFCRGCYTSASTTRTATCCAAPSS